jgi:hypothetical protein
LLARGASGEFAADLLGERGVVRVGVSFALEALGEDCGVEVA